MKLFIQLLLLVFINISVSQNSRITVEYTFNDNFRYQETKSILNCNNRNAIFKTFIEKFNTGGEPVADYETNTITIGGNRIDTYQIHNKLENSLISFDIRKRDIYKIKENIPNLNWDLNYKDVKVINNYKCNKATLKFRGREYIAWYTTQISINFGPWKFSGLPGLILEVKDLTNTYSWKATKIKFPSDLKIKIPYKKYKEVSLEEMVKIEKENLEKQRAKLRSIMPRGTVFSAPKNSRKGIEIIYEWED